LCKEKKGEPCEKIALFIHNQQPGIGPARQHFAIFPAGPGGFHDPEQLVELGRKIFFDPNLSVNSTQSCASCHDPETGFTGPDSEINALGAVEPGAVSERFGNRKPPTANYA
jgi:cytochrome c peroxidase